MSLPRNSLIVTALVALAFGAGCFGSRGDELEMDGSHRGKLGMEEVSGYDGKPSGKLRKGKKVAAKKKRKGPNVGGSGASASATTTTTTKTAAKVANAEANANADVAAAPKPSVATGCEELVTRYLPGYQKLAAALDQTTLAALDAQTKTALAVTPQMCAEDDTRAAAVNAVAALVNGSSGKVGVILPTTGARGKFAAFVVAGMRAAFQDGGMPFDGNVLLRDSASNPKQAERAYAELILRDKVQLVVGGLEKGDAEVLAKWAGAVYVPTILLNRERELVDQSPYDFRVYPDEGRLADALAAAAKRKGWNRVVILKPSTGKSNGIAQYFDKAFRDKGGTVVQQVLYTAGNFDSMSAAARLLFRTDVAERREEYTQAYKKARKQAQEEGVPFDPRMVILKPIVNFDAVFLPDDFRTARHFVKLFKFHMVDKLGMIGNHEWRAPDIVEPFEEFLDGAVFADFIGSYQKLPSSITVPTLSSPYFVHPSNVVPTDFRLIGYRAARAAAAAAKIAGVPRRALPESMLKLPDTGGLFGRGSVFAADRSSNWPTYVFTIGKRGLNLEAEQTTAGNP